MLAVVSASMLAVVSASMLAVVSASALAVVSAAATRALPLSAKRLNRSVVTLPAGALAGATGLMSLLQLAATTARQAAIPVILCI